MTAAEQFATYLDAVAEQQARLHGAAASGDDVVDAEFEEVDENRK